MKHLLAVPRGRVRELRRNASALRAEVNVARRLRSRGGSRRGWVLRRVLVASDLAALGLAYAMMFGVLAAVGRPVFVPGDLVALVALLPLFVLLASLLGSYHDPERRIDRSFADELGTAFFVMTLWSWFWLIGRAVLEPGSVAVLASVAFWAGGIAAIATFRAFLRRVLRGRSWYRQPTLLLGSRSELERVGRRLDRHPEYGLDVVGALCLDDVTHDEISFHGDVAMAMATDPTRSVNGHEVGSGNKGRRVLEQIVAGVAATGAQRVIATGWEHGPVKLTELIQTLISADVHVDLVSGEPEALFSAGTLHHLEGMTILTVSPPRITKAKRLIKRVMDLSIAGLGLALLWPLLTYIAIRIKLDSPGSILFFQERVGREGKRFQLVKFRTMVANAEEYKRELEPLNIHGSQENAMFKVPRDPRITSFGAWLRRWSLDELPQLWNVLTGEMSLVGPRPLIPDEASLVSGRHRERFWVRPGITGPWQVLGRSDIPFEDMVQLDYVYVATWTLREDMKILMQTLGAIREARGAY